MTAPQPHPRRRFQLSSTIALLSLISVSLASSNSVSELNSETSLSSVYQSSVFEDIYAYPKFQVQLGNEVIPHSQVPWDSLAGFLPERNTFTAGTTSGDVGDIDLESNEGTASTKATLQGGNDPPSILMKDSAGNQWLCKLPLLFPPQHVNPSVAETQNVISSKDEVEKALDLLSPMSRTCLYYQQGWWMYEVCHGRHVRQFHQSTDPRLASEYILGVFPNFVRLENEQIPPEIAQVKLARESGTWGIPHIGGMKKYLSVVYVDGTLCDLTNQPRTIEVQYYCNRAVEQVEFFKERSICNYLAIIHTPQLCRPPFFNITEYDLHKPHSISCSPVVSDEFYSLSTSSSSSTPSSSSTTSKKSPTKDSKPNPVHDIDTEEMAEAEDESENTILVNGSPVQISVKHIKLKGAIVDVAKSLVNALGRRAPVADIANFGQTDLDDLFREVLKEVTKENEDSKEHDHVPEGENVQKELKIKKRKKKSKPNLVK